MAMTFDAALKNLARAYPNGFLTAFDRPTTLPVSLLNVDLSAISKSTDFVIGLGDPVQEILHFEFQASASATKHRDILVYNALLHRLHEVPIHSIIILLRPQAAHSNLDGSVHYAARPNQGRMEFGYQIVRLWEKPSESLVAGDIGIVPLAPLGKLPSDVANDDALANVIRRVVTRLVHEAPSDKTGELLTASYLLAGLRMEPEQALAIFKGAQAMEESSTYMAILEQGMQKGEEAAMKRFILRQGEKRLDEPTAELKSRLDSIHDVDRLQMMADKILEISNWDELFAE